VLVQHRGGDRTGLVAPEGQDSFDDVIDEVIGQGAEHRPSGLAG
jgi:hypothetical protein